MASAVCRHPHALGLQDYVRNALRTQGMWVSRNCRCNSAVQGSPSYEPHVQVAQKGVRNCRAVSPGNPRGEWTTEAELQRLAGIYAGLPTTWELDLELLEGELLAFPVLHRNPELLPSGCISQCAGPRLQAAAHSVQCISCRTWTLYGSPFFCRRQRHRTRGHSAALANRPQAGAAGGARAAVRIAGRPSQSG